MTELSPRRRAALAAGALACAVLGSLSALLALDVHRWQDALAAGDERYSVAPERDDLWRPSLVLPGGISRATLGAGDDVEFRSAMRAARLARLEDTTVSDPDIALLRNDAQARLEAIASGSGDARRRSRAANLLGALGLARLVTESLDRAALIESTVANLQRAVVLDPGNDEAKYNLEVVLQRSSGEEITEASGGANPSPGGAGSKGAGAGRPGSGY